MLLWPSLVGLEQRSPPQSLQPPGQVVIHWQVISGNWVLLPRRPIAIIHFLGGAFVATTPQLTYRRLLEFLADQGYAIVATPFTPDFDHFYLAQTTLNQLEQTLTHLSQSLQLKRFLPIYGLGHSMGCKLHLLIGSLYAVHRAGNVLISFNNEQANQAIPGMEFLRPMVPLEFAPTPHETQTLIRDRYQIRRNLLVKFADDTLDHTQRLASLLEPKFPQLVTVYRQPGNHLTPLGPDLQWQTGSAFSPFDALGQWLRQEVYRELAQLERTILHWLDPVRIN